MKTAFDGVVFTDFSMTKRESCSKIQAHNIVDLLLPQQSIIHKEPVPASQTINSAFYQAVWNPLLQRMRRVRPLLHKTGKWILLHDNAPAQSAIRVSQFLAQKMVVVLDYPP